MKIMFYTIGLARALDVVRVWASQDAYFNPGYDAVKTAGLINTNEVLGDHLNALNLLPEEYRVELISLSKSLEVSGNEDGLYCSGRVSKMLQQCTTGTLSVEDRDEAAMLLTICDRARDYAPPMECKGLNEDFFEADKLAVKRCAIALDQHQNFQRTFDVYRIIVIPEKCKSLNSIFNIDPSRELYQNITIGLMSLIQSLAGREDRNEGYFTQWDDHISTFQDVTADLSATKDVLAKYNEQFANSLTGMMHMLTTSLDDLMNEGRKANKELSFDLKGEMIVIEEEHKSSLALAISSAEASFSAGLKTIIDIAQERQNTLDSAAFLTIDQLMGAVKDLSVARQQFETLSVFVRETTTKAYNQAFLLDAKQHDVADSLAGLSKEIKGLSNTAHQLNTSLTDIREDSDNFSINSNARRTGTSWLDSATLFRSLFRYLGLSPLWALLFLLLSLPRFLLEQMIKMFLWIGLALVSYVTSMLFGHREQEHIYEGINIERGNPMSYQTDDISLLNLPRMNHHHRLDPSLSQETYSAKELSSYQHDKTPYYQIPAPFSISGSRSVRYPVNEDWIVTRTRTRGISRVPERLYAPESAPDRLARTRL